MVSRPVDILLVDVIFRRTRVLLAPSLWQECCPLVVMEALLRDKFVRDAALRERLSKRDRTKKTAAGRAAPRSRRQEAPPHTLQHQAGALEPLQ